MTKPSPSETEMNYDQNLLAERYVQMKYGGYNKPHVFARMDTENIIRLVKDVLRDYEIPVDCALDIGCGQGHLCRTLIKKNLAHSTVGIDKSERMIQYARSTQPDTKEYCNYMVLDAARDDLSTILKRKFPLVTESYMLMETSDVEQLSKIASNIANVCSHVFVGLISNPNCDFQSDNVRKLIKHGIINRQYESEEEVEQKMKFDGMKYRMIFEAGKTDQLTLVDHWYSAQTYEKVFRDAGFSKGLKWMTLKLESDNEQQEDYLVDLVNSHYFIGFIATI